LADKQTSQVFSFHNVVMMTVEFFNDLRIYGKIRKPKENGY